MVDRVVKIAYASQRVGHGGGGRKRKELGAALSKGGEGFRVTWGWGGMFMKERTDR